MRGGSGGCTEERDETKIGVVNDVDVFIQCTEKQGGLVLYSRCLLT